MKKIILFVSVIFLLVSCKENKGINIPTSDSINEIKVEKLFVVDGITVYRFYDGGRVVYFIGCPVRCSEKQMLKSPVKLLI